MFLAVATFSHCSVQKPNWMTFRVPRYSPKLANSLVLNLVIRSMTLVEKQQLRKMIQELPPRNLDRVVEIIQRNKPIDRYSRDEIHVDLEKEVISHILLLLVSN